jgi:uncharacterized protein
VNPLSGRSPTWTPPSATELTSILGRTRHVAIVGVSVQPSRPSHRVASYLLARSDYQLHFVNPTVDEVLGQRAYPDLASLPVVPDLVDVFRRTAELGSVAEQFLSLPGVADEPQPVLWFQLGLFDQAVADRVTAAGFTIVMDRCLEVDHARLLSGTPLRA